MWTPRLSTRVDLWSGKRCRAGLLAATGPDANGRSRSYRGSLVGLWLFANGHAPKECGLLMTSDLASGIGTTRHEIDVLRFDRRGLISEALAVAV